MHLEAPRRIARRLRELLARFAAAALDLLLEDGDETGGAAAQDADARRHMVAALADRHEGGAAHVGHEQRPFGRGPPVDQAELVPDQQQIARVPVAVGDEAAQDVAHGVRLVGETYLDALRRPGDRRVRETGVDGEPFGHVHPGRREVDDGVLYAHQAPVRAVLDAGRVP